MSFTPLTYVFKAYYAGGADSWFLQLYKRMMHSRWAVIWLFGMKVLPREELAPFFGAKVPIYYGLTTILLKKVVREKVRRSPNLKLLEIGVGAFAVLSGYLSRWVEQTIDAIDIDRACIEIAQKHVDLNGVAVRVFHSNLFSSISNSKYDVIFWNMPYEQDPNMYLPALFEQVPSFLNEGGQLIIVYNTRDLPRKDAIDILSNYERLHLQALRTWWWNIHDVLVIGKK